MSRLILLLLIVSIESIVVNASGRKNYVEFYGNKCEIVNKCQSSIYKYNNFNSGGVESGTFILVSIGDSCCHLFESISKSLSEHYIIYDELDNDSRISYQDHIKSFESTLHSEFQYDNNTDYKVVNKTNIISMIFTCLIIITFVIIKNHLNEQKYTYDAYRWMRKCKAVRFFTIRTLLMLIYCVTPNIVRSSVEIYCNSTTTNYGVYYNSYEVTNTNSATVNYDSIQLNVEDGNYLEFSTCNSDGDTYLQIYDINNNFIAVDDDSCNYLGCGCGAKITGTVDLQQEHSHSNNITWELRLGCWANTTCTSTLRMDGCRYYGTSLDDNIWDFYSTSVPTYNPTSAPTHYPTTHYPTTHYPTTHNPTSVPTHYPNNGDAGYNGALFCLLLLIIFIVFAFVYRPPEKREDEEERKARSREDEEERNARSREDEEDRRARSRYEEEDRRDNEEERRDKEEERRDKEEEMLRAAKGLPEPFWAAQPKQKRKEERAKREQERAKRERERNIMEESRTNSLTMSRVKRERERKIREEEERVRRIREEERVRRIRKKKKRKQAEEKAERIAREEAEAAAKEKAREEKERVWREEDRVKREKIHQAKLSRAREDDEFRIRFCLGIEDKWSSDDDSDVSDEEGGKLYDEYLQINQDLLGLDPVLEKNTRRRLVIRQKNIVKEFDDLYDNWK